MSFFDELKRRNVFRAGIAYVVLAWLILQVTDVVLSNLGVPYYVFKLILLLLVIGFPIVLIIAWIFELTPAGLKRDSEVENSQFTTGVMSRHIDFAIIAILIVAVGYFAYDKFIVSKAVSDKSIAVLPFVNMSGDAEQEYFADGLSEELLNLLARIQSLRVIARTSSFVYKNRDEATISQIARDLNVGHVLDGSVRKDSSTKVRITVHLIRAVDESHLWSDTYDVTLDDIFAVQDQISAAVVEQLRLKLLGAVPTARETNPDAYALYLQARELSRQSTKEGHEQAIGLYEQALEIESDYAAAWSGMADSLIILGERVLRPLDEAFAEATTAVERALAIDPNYAPAHASLGRIAIVHGNDLPAGARHLERALALDPGNALILRQAATFLANLNRLDDAIRLLEYTAARDPVSSAVHSNLALSYFFAGRIDDTIAAYRKAIQLSPNAVGYHSWLGMALMMKNDHAAALAAIEQEPDEGWRLLGLSAAYHAQGKSTESDQYLDEMIQKHGQEWAYNIAYVLAFRSEAGRAFKWLDKAQEINDPGLSEIVVEPLFDNIRSDARWASFMERIGKTPEDLAAIKFNVTSPE